MAHTHEPNPLCSFVQCIRALMRLGGGGAVVTKLQVSKVDKLLAKFDCGWANWEFAWIGKSCYQPTSVFVFVEVVRYCLPTKTPLLLDHGCHAISECSWRSGVGETMWSSCSSNSVLLLMFGVCLVQWFARQISLTALRFCSGACGHQKISRHYFYLYSIWWGHYTDFSSHLSAGPSSYCINRLLVLVERYN